MKQDRESLSKNKRIEDLNVLIVDDDEVSSDLLETILEDVVRKITCVRSGIEAIEICRNNPDLDLVLMDIKMTDMDGYDATAKIRIFNKDILVIAQTAYALLGDKEKALDAGCDDYIAKPIDKALLLEILDKHMGEDR